MLNVIDTAMDWFIVGGCVTLVVGVIAAAVDCYVSEWLYRRSLNKH